jgi:hypothetical protein
MCVPGAGGRLRRTRLPALEAIGPAGRSDRRGDVGPVWRRATQRRKHLLVPGRGRVKARVRLAVPDRARESTDRGNDVGCRLKTPAHLDRGRTSLRHVVVSVEQEQQCITAELEELPAAGGSDVKHRPEDTAQRLDEFLGSDPPASREALGQRGETRDVGEDHGALDELPPTVRIIDDPIERDARNMTFEAIAGTRSVVARKRVRPFTDQRSVWRGSASKC